MHLAELFIRLFSFYIDARVIQIEPAAAARFPFSLLSFSFSLYLASVVTG